HSNHLLIELEIPLLLPPGFSPLLPNGSGGVYSPDPASWNASAKNDLVDPPISSAIFQIQPNLSTTINNNAMPEAAPEPSTWGLLASGALLFFWKGRKL